MTKEKRLLKWHEEFFIGFIFLSISLTVLLNGFTAIASSFVKNGEVEGGVSKQKGILALFSLLESGWWKYVIILVFGFLAYSSIKDGIEKYRNK